MNNFHSYITPKQAAALDEKAGNPIRDYRQLLRQYKDKRCQCGEPVWIYAGTGLCFSCTTGEADASDDYELTEGGQ